MVTGNTHKIFLPRNAPAIPFLPGLQPSTDLWVKAYVYDFKADEIVLARKQEFEFSNSQQTYVPIDGLLTTTTMILGDFTKDKRVKSIFGPFDTDGNVVTQIKLGESYTFRATPNQLVAEFYLLAIKWAYRLDDGELTMFKNQTEIANGTQGQITVTFPKSFKASKIKVYGFYKAASERVCVEVGTDYMGESVVEVEENADVVAVTKEESPDSTETENELLVWGAKVSNEFRDKVVLISKEIWKDNWFAMANGLMAVMYRETAGSFASNQLEGYKSLIAKDKMTKDDFYKKIENSDEKTSRAVGLIQFTQSALVSMKEFKNSDGFDKLHELKLKYAKMTAVEQLDKVKKYFLSVKTLPKTKEDIYVAVFAPNFVGKPLNTIMYKKGTASYQSNKSLDKNGNGIEVKELLDKFYESLKDGGKKENISWIQIDKEVIKVENEDAKNCPDDNSQCFNYADVVDNPQISSDNGGKNNNRFNSSKNRKTPHRGLDILTGNNKVKVHSILCGEVVFTVTKYKSNEHRSTSGTLGNLVVVKSKDKEGQIVFIMYCHLDSVLASINQKIKHGSIIGISGSTGNAGSVYKNGVLISGIYPKFYHIHIEASTKYVLNSATFINVASSRINPEQYMKTKFDSDGNNI